MFDRLQTVYLNNRHNGILVCSKSGILLFVYFQVHSIELGPHAEGNLALSNHMDTIKFDDETNKYDFPVSIQVFQLIVHNYITLADVERKTFFSTA